MTGYCENHPTVEARLACVALACGKSWCRDCAAPVGSTAHRVMCPACGHALGKVRVARTGWETVKRSVARAISTEGLITAFAFAVFHAAAGAFGILDVFYLSALVGFYFTIVRHVGDGGDGLPGPSDATDAWTEIVGFVLRGLACVAIGLVPMILGMSAHVASGTALALALVGQLYMPAMLLAYVITNNTLAIVWPVTWVRVIARAPSAYARFCGLWLASVAVGLVVGFVGLGAPDTWVAALAVAFVWNLFWFTQAAMIGEFLNAHAGDFGVD